MATIAVSEIFGPTVQGEGMLMGKPTVFVRTGGCDYQHCSWCDTLYAVLPEYRSTWKKMTTEEVLTAIQTLSPQPILVTLSGGNPAMQPLDGVIARGKEDQYTFCMETQGSIAPSWLCQLDYLTLSPKPPSSGMKTRIERLDRCVELAQKEGRTRISLKVVIADDADYAYAHTIAGRYPCIPLYLQPCNPNPPHIAPFDREAVFQRLDWLITKVTQEHWNTVTVLPQLHSLLWGNTRGV